MPDAPNDDADIDLFIRLDRLGAIGGIVAVVIANLFVIKIAGVWLMLPCLIGLVIVLSLALHAVRTGNVLRSLVLIAVGNWSIAVIVSLLLPFLWPVMALTVIMPLLLASTRLTRTQIVPAIIAAAVLTALVATIGLLNDDGGVVDDIDDTLELVVVTTSLVVQIVPIGLVLWQHNQRQRVNVAALQDLNRELQRSEIALAESRDRVVHAADTERRRIERDLHDGAQQSLVALGVRLRLLMSKTDETSPLREGIDTVVDELDGAINQIRELAQGIYPPLLQMRGLPDALSAVIRRAPTTINASLGDIGRHGEDIESALYFTACEALTNATKHAPGANVEIALRRHEGGLELRVEDDGGGFDVADARQSRGFDNMRDRLAAAGGTLLVESNSAGTTLVATTPAASEPRP